MFKYIQSLVSAALLLTVPSLNLYSQIIPITQEHIQELLCLDATLSYDEGTYVRIMPGKRHSPNPCQQKPYVNHRINGQSVNRSGKVVPHDSPEAHIPIDEFIYRDTF